MPFRLLTPLFFALTLTLALPGLRAGDLAVDGPTGAPLPATGAAVDVGTVAVEASSAARTFTIYNYGAAPLTGISITLDGANPEDFALATSGAGAELNISGSTTFQAVFRPLQPGARTAVISIASSDADSPFQIALTGTAVASGTAAIQIIENPASQIAEVNGSITLRAAAQGNAGLKYQWKKNNANVPGATAPDLALTGLKTTHAGAYKCLITSTLNGKAVTATTTEAQLAVVDTAPKAVAVSAGVKTTFTVTAAGNGLSYQWLAGADPLEGKTGKTLVLTSPQVIDTGGYSCRITAPGGSLVSGAFELTVYNEAPEFLASEGDSLPAAIVSGSYNYPVPVNPATNRVPTGFTATGLPPGLTIHKTTGIILGKPTKSKTEPYQVTLTASNARGKTSVKVQLTVSALPANLVGTYTAVLSRFTDINADLGGRLDFTTTAAGSFSGKLFLGDLTYPFKGALDADVDTPLVATAAVTLSRKGKATLTVTFTLDSDSNWISAGQITDGAAVLDFSGWRNVWNKSNPATALAGYYTFGLAIPEGLVDEAIPQGGGFGSFTLAPATGLLTAAGKLPDGTPFSIGTFAGPGGELALFKTLYGATNRGSLLGNLFIGPADPATDNTVYGALSWWYPGSNAKGARAYSDGFGPLDLTVNGAVYPVPASPKAALGVNESTLATLTFTGPFSDIPGISPDLDIFIGVKSKLTLDPNNPRKTTMTLTAASGAFSGGFTLVDPDLLAPPKNVTRTGAYSGIIVRDPATGTQSGKGYFLLPQRPAEAGQTAANTKILSGAVSFGAAVP